MSITKNKIINARKAIRKKLQMLKQGQLDQDRTLKEIFSPVTQSIYNLKKSGSKEEEDEIVKYCNAHSASRIDSTYGVSKVKPHVLGSQPISITADTIQIGDKQYQRTPGLMNLIFLKTSKTSKYSQKDLDTYKEILQLTDLHKKPNGEVKSTGSIKYIKIIKPLLAAENAIGEGIDLKHKTVNNALTEYVYYDDPKDLIDRLNVLTASASAGNTAHSNEIVSLISELRGRGIIE